MKEDMIGPKQYLEEFFLKISQNENKIAGVNIKVQYDFSGDNNGKWYAEIVDGKVQEVVEGTIENPTCVFKAKYRNFYRAFAGESNPMTAFMTGKIKLKGDMGVAMKLRDWSQ